jgi:hypothetical protein
MIIKFTHMMGIPFTMLRLIFPQSLHYKHHFSKAAWDAACRSLNSLLKRRSSSCTLHLSSQNGILGMLLSRGQKMEVGSAKSGLKRGRGRRVRPIVVTAFLVRKLVYGLALTCKRKTWWFMRTAFFWAITQRVVVISYRRFGTRPLKMGPIGCPKISARIYHYTLRNIPEQRSPHLTSWRKPEITHCWVIFPFDRTLRVRCWNFRNVYTYSSKLTVATLSKNSTNKAASLSQKRRVMASPP